MTCNRKVGKRRSLVDGSEVTGEIVKRLLRVMHHLHKCPFQPVYRLRSQPLLRLRVHHHQIGVVPLKLISFLAHFWVSEFVSIAESLGVNGENCAVGGGLPYRKVRVCVCMWVNVVCMWWSVPFKKLWFWFGRRDGYLVQYRVVWCSTADPLQFSFYLLMALFSWYSIFNLLYLDNFKFKIKVLVHNFSFYFRI